MILENLRRLSNLISWNSAKIFGGMDLVIELVDQAAAVDVEGFEDLQDGFGRDAPGLGPADDVEVFLAGFEAIDQGRRVLEDAMASAQARQRADDLIWEGNVELLEHEQRALVQPNFDRLSRSSAWLVAIGSATSFEVRGVRQEIADFTSFYLYSLTRGIPHALRARAWPRITRFDDRWRWLVTSVVPRFRRFDADTHLVDASLRHIFDEARDFASSPCVLPRSPADGPRRAAPPRLWHRPQPKG